MSRKQFITNLGGTCRNWRWSWSFVNHERNWVAFGAWKENETDAGQVIFSEDWEYDNGRRMPAFSECVEHIGLVEDGYKLFTFTMEREDVTDIHGNIGPKIKSFDPETFRQKKLQKGEGVWLAVDGEFVTYASDMDVNQNQVFPEGALKETIVNKYERSAAARAHCIALYGYDCIACGENMSEKYGVLGEEFIHVHHLISPTQMGPNYKVDPSKDLVPVCPNCHAMIHRKKDFLSIEELRVVIDQSKAAWEGKP